MSGTLKDQELRASIHAGLCGACVWGRFFVTNGNDLNPQGVTTQVDEVIFDARRSSVAQGLVVLGSSLPVAIPFDDEAGFPVFRQKVSHFLHFRTLCCRQVVLVETKHDGFEGSNYV